MEQEECEGQRREFYYLAQIALEVARSRGGKDAASLRLDNFLLRFEQRKPATPPTEEELEKQVALSKAKWMAVAGAGRFKTRTPPPAPVPPVVKGVVHGRRKSRT